MASLNQLKRTGKRSYRRVGRGNGSSRGKQSGRGGKGQTARAGHKIRPEMRDIIKKLPKRRGYGKNRGRTVNGSRIIPATISIAKIDAVFENGAEISLKALREVGMIKRTDRAAKVVGGASTKKFTFKDVAVSKSAGKAA